MLVRISLAALTLGALQARAWGELGHATVASIAQGYLLPDVLVRVNEILQNDPAPFVSKPKPKTSPQLWEVALWADDWRGKEEGKWTAPLHFINAHDKPYQECNVDYKRDCAKEGCVLTGIANFTARVADKSLDATQQAQALKFLTHYIGDIHQPLHAEDKARGGTRLNVKWEGGSSNLHSVWDTKIPEKVAGKYSPETVKKWTQKLVREIDDGKRVRDVSDWVECTNPEEALDCALSWARDVNTLICSYVLGKDTDPTGKETSTWYFDGAAPIVETQIAKGGVRLAAWLNTIFAGENGFSHLSHRQIGQKEKQKAFTY